MASLEQQCLDGLLTVAKEGVALVLADLHRTTSKRPEVVVAPSAGRTGRRGPAQVRNARTRFQKSSLFASS